MKKLFRIRQSGNLRKLLFLKKGERLKISYINESGGQIEKSFECIVEELKNE